MILNISSGSRLRSLFFVALFCVAIAGCSGDSTVPVEGTVTLDGAPLSGAQVVFYGGTGPNQAVFIGRTDEQGKYQLHRSGKDASGVDPGTYDVSISTAVIEGYSDELTKAPPERVPLKYRDRSQKFEVPEGGTQEANFDMKSR